MREETKVQFGLIIGGMLLIPLGIAMLYAQPHLPFGGWTAILGAGCLLTGISGLVSRLWMSIRHPDEYKVLPADLAHRLTALGEDPAAYQDMVHSYGARFVRMYTEGLEKAASQFREWAPKLREFADKCRAANPCPDLSTLSARDHAKLDIYRSLINEAERLPRRVNEVVICSVPTMAIPIAQELWPGDEKRCVFLTPDELNEWNTGYTHPAGTYWWYRYYWWHIEDPPAPNSEWDDHIADKVPAGLDPWLVTSGLRWAALAGGEVVELWSWDGEEAKSCGKIAHISF